MSCLFPTTGPLAFPIMRCPVLSRDYLPLTTVACVHRVPWSRSPAPSSLTPAHSPALGRSLCLRSRTALHHGTGERSVHVQYIHVSLHRFMEKDGPSWTVVVPYVKVDIERQEP